jgi:hypothetical protein
MKHSYAEILMAIANGEQIQFINSLGNWNDMTNADVLNEIRIARFKPSEFRVKPKTILVNGIECPLHIKSDSNIKFGFNVLISCGPRDPCGCDVNLWYKYPEDANTVFNALIKPFKETE